MKRTLLLALSLVAVFASGAGGGLRPDGAAARAEQENGAPKKGPGAKPGVTAPGGGKVEVLGADESDLKRLLEVSTERRRPLLVNFWATWCEPCRREFPDLVKIREEFSTGRLDFVTVSLDDVSEMEAGVPQFLGEMRAGHIPAYLLNAKDTDAAINLFDPSWRGELPATFLFDRAGRLAFKHMGRVEPAQLRAAIERTLAADGDTTPAHQQPQPAPTQQQPATAQPQPAPAPTTPATGGNRPEQLLAYDASAPLDIKVVGTERQGGVTVEDITFRGVGETIAAYVVRPSEGAGPFAGVLFVHWFAPPEPTSNRTQYLDEARALARRGTVSLLVSTFWSDPERYKARRWQTDFDNSVAQAKNLRRALDVLVSLPGVEQRRVGFVGHDYGAMFGALVAAADARPKAYVLIAGTSRFADWYLFGSSSGKPTGEALEAYRKQLALLDPVSVVGAGRAAFFFQFGEADHYTPRENFIAFYMAAPSPKRIATYASDHDMTADIIRHERTAWVAEQLSLPPSR